MKKFTKTTSGKKGGLFVGKSHAKGGIPAIVVDTGQPIEVEGGEVIINKEASKKYWKELSEINQSAGNGVAIPPPMEFSADVERYKDGGKVTMSAVKQGTEIEMEHAKTIAEFKNQGVSIKEVARKIAKDHLKENPNYYKIISKLKLAKGGEVVCRSCGNSWLKHQKDVGMNVFECDKCDSQNSKFYKKGGQTESLSLPEKEKLYEEWRDLVNMSKVELQKFYNSVEGKQAGLSDSEAKELGIDNGRTSARWIIKMKDVPFVNWTDDMWRWAKKQINFIKRMSGNKGSLYNEKGIKTRKHTSLLIWGHNPEKFNLGGATYLEPNSYGLKIIIQNVKPENKFKGAYKLIFDILDKNTFLYNPYGTSYEELIQNDFQIEITPMPDNNILQEIAKINNVKIVDKFAKGSKIPSKNKGGDCYYVAGTIAMNKKLPTFAKEKQYPDFNGTPYVVHSEVSGQGSISGLRYGHAWVEDDLYVYDFSNGREIVFPKQLYYAMGNVVEKKPKYYKYTFKDAVDKMLQTGHYGSWELKTESGL